jgi:hypothetical protein
MWRDDEATRGVMTGRCMQLKRPLQPVISRTHTHTHTHAHTHYRPSACRPTSCCCGGWPRCKGRPSSSTPRSVATPPPPHREDAHLYHEATHHPNQTFASLYASDTHTYHTPRNNRPWPARTRWWGGRRRSRRAPRPLRECPPQGRHRCAGVHHLHHALTCALHPQHTRRHTHTHTHPTQTRARTHRELSRVCTRDSVGVLAKLAPRMPPVTASLVYRSYAEKVGGRPRIHHVDGHTRASAAPGRITQYLH